MNTPFDPRYWYWAAADGRVFSGPAQAIVNTADPDFAAWVKAGSQPTVWPADGSGAQSNAALLEVLQPYGLGAVLAPAPTQADLVARAYAKQAELQGAGISVNIGSSSTPDVVDVATTDAALAISTGAVQIPSLASVLGKTAPSSYLWVNNILPNGQAGAQVNFNATQIATIQYAITTYIQATFSALGAVLNAIAAGTITTLAQIDTPPSAVGAWPATSY